MVHQKNLINIIKVLEKKDFQVDNDIFYITYENKKSVKQIQIKRLGNEKQQQLCDLESYYIKIKKK